MCSLEHLRVAVLRVTGQIEQAMLPENDQMRLDHMRELVGGSLETVPVSGHRYLVFSESAKDSTHVVNRMATALALADGSIQTHDYLAGTVILVSEQALN